MANSDELLQAQQDIGKEIQRIISNYKKDSPDRKKTRIYFIERINQLEAQWDKFNNNDTQLRSMHSPPFDQAYFTKNYYNGIQRLYEEYSQILSQSLNELEQSQPPPPPSTGAPFGTDQDKAHLELPPKGATGAKPKEKIHEDQQSQHNLICKIMRKQSTAIDALQRLLKKLDAELQTPQELKYYTLRARNIDHYWSQIECCHQEICEVTDNPSAHGYQVETYIALEEVVQNCLLNLVTTESKVPTAQLSTQQAQPLTLPKITLPKFDGDYMKWPQFNDLYTELVHKQMIDNARKMYYLKANLSGEAAKLIQHLPASEQHYHTAWEILRGRYNNTRLIVSAFLNNLLNQPQCTGESAADIKRLHDTTRESLHGIANMRVDVEGWDAIITHVILQKLDLQSRSIFEQSVKNPRDIQRTSELLKFLETRFQMLESLGGKREKSIVARRSSNRQSTLVMATKNSPNKPSQYCIFCKHKEHRIQGCPSFRNSSLKDRIHHVKRLRLCFNCLGHSHTIQQCNSRSCLKCNQRHHTLLHPNTAPGQGVGQQVHQVDEKLQTATSSMHAALHQFPPNPYSKYIFLSTVSMIVKNKHNEDIQCRAVLDAGSQVNLITEALYNRLGLSAGTNRLKINGVGKTKLKSQKRISLPIMSKITGFSFPMDTLIVSEITSAQPAIPFDVSTWKIPRNIKLADPQFNTPGKIDMLIGAEHYTSLTTVGQIELSPSLPLLQNTLLGWIVQGKFEEGQEVNAYSCGISTIDLEHQLQKFWTLEDTSTSKRAMTAAEQWCEDYFKETTKRDENGHFIVRLPFGQDPSVLGNSKYLAAKRFFQIEKRLQKNAELQSLYQAFMEEYIKLDHMEEIADQHIPENHYYLPHHFVLKPESTTTKLRVVFDGSAKTTSNYSLNDLLLPGPVIQDGLLPVLLRFRMHKYVFSADIAKMYRQIMISSDQRKYQLIFWRASPTEQLKTYQLSTVTYGTTAAPYLATKCLQQLADEQEDLFPRAAKVIKQDFYVDDLMTGTDSLEEAVQLQSQLRSLLNSSGFALRKWCANHGKLLESIPKEHIEVKLEVDEGNDTKVKTLGLTWFPKVDSFMITINLNEHKKITKRTILSDIAHIFDPLGLVNPVVVWAKILLQELWILKLDWDASLPIGLHTKWKEFREDLPELEKVNIPRRITINEPSSIELHAFSDASERAYGVCLYLRSTDCFGSHVMHLLCARSRVAPTKKTTIPRLELCAAKLAVELAKDIRIHLRMPSENVFFWTDSTIVLNWISSDVSSFQVFVANRISIIQGLSNRNQWRHIESELNPADLVSRGATPKNMLKAPLWCHGPTFLKLPQHQWPTQPAQVCMDLPERKKARTILIAKSSTQSILEEINHRNSFPTLQRIVALIQRFTKNVRTTQDRRNLTPQIQSDEIFDSLMFIVREVQREEFYDEVKELQRNEAIRPSSDLASLSPFLDNKGVIRVGGRLRQANIPWEAKHPIVLPKSHWVTKLLVEYIHKKHLHAGPQALLALVRQRFWPIHGKSLIRSIVHQCIPCTRSRPKLMVQLMGDLPKERVLPSRPFSNVGVDFCGPIQVHYKIRGKRPTKAYISVFVCFSTKACHLEIVSDLTSAAFIGCLKRFIARRGRPIKIFCDNATNFIGARNELQELQGFFWSQENQETASRYCAEEQIQWRPIPPRSPHFGGLWEAAVKAAKSHMKHVLAGASLTYEEVSTVIAEIEAILNSRPITPLPDHPDDIQALTPAHFLVGEPLTTLPNPQLPPENISLLARWERVKQIHKEFWRRWKNEYLHQLQVKGKWTKEAEDIKIGTIVIIHDESAPPLKWPLGKIINTHIGPDGRIRVVDIQTASGIIKRSIQRVSPLPITINEEEGPQRDIITTTKMPKAKRRRITPINPSWNTKDSLTPKCSSLKRYELAYKNNNIPMDPTSPRKPSPQRDKRLSVGAVLFASLICLLNPIPTTTHPIEVLPFVTHPAIYFEGLGQTSIVTDEWNLITFFQMEKYWEELATLQASIKKMKVLCQPLQQYKDYCTATISFLKHHLYVVNSSNNLLKATDRQTRTKRGVLNIVGNIANKLFGVLDDEYAEKMTANMVQVNKNEQHLLHLIQNQTSVIDSTLNIMKNSSEHVNNQLQLIQEYFSQVREEIRQTQTNQTEERVLHRFNSFTIYVLLLLNDYQRIQEALVDMTTDAHHGRLNPLILTPTQLRQELSTIQSHIPPTLSFPTQLSGSNIRWLYQTATVRARVLRNYIIFNIRIPLINAEKFELFNIVPIAIHMNGTTTRIRPASEYMAINLHRDQYVPMSSNDLANCAGIAENHYICSPHHSTHIKEMDNSQCELQLFTNSTLQTQIPASCTLEKIPSRGYWTKLEEPNTWLYALDKPKIFNVACGTIAFQQEIQEYGLLRFKQNCLMKHDNTILSSQYSSTATITNSVVPKVRFNLTEMQERISNQSSIKYHPIQITNNTVEINALKGQLNNIQSNSHIQAIPVHNTIINYSGLLIAVIVLIILILIMRKWNSSNTIKKPTPRPRKIHDATEEAFEITEI